VFGPNSPVGPSVAKKVAKTKTSSNYNVEGPSKGKEKEEQKEKKKEEEEEEEEGEKGDREKGVLDNLIMLEEQVAVTYPSKDLAAWAPLLLQK